MVISAILIIGFYASVTVFFTDMGIRSFVYLRAESTDSLPSSYERCSLGSAAAGVFDILFLLRLMKADPLVWIWEWLFHASFFLVLLRHLRYVLDPVPDWVAMLQEPGIAAGYVLLISLSATAVIKLTYGKGYISSYNFLLLSLLLGLSASGLIIRTLLRAELTGIKYFTLGLAGFSPVQYQMESAFTFHFALFQILLVSLPSHILAAPLTILEARFRKSGLKGVIHEE